MNKLSVMPLHLTLAAADLVAFLDMHGQAAPFTLRPECIASARDAALLSRLSVVGLLDETSSEWAAMDDARVVAGVLLAPRCLIELSVWNDGSGGRTAIAFPAAPAYGCGVVCNREADQVTLAGFVDDAVIIGLVEPVLAALPEDAAVSFAAQLTSPQMVVLSVLLDMLAFDGRVLRPFSAGFLSEWLAIWWGASPRASLTGQVFALTLMTEPLAEAVVIDILEQFLLSGLLERVDERRYRLVSQLTDVVGLVAATDAGFDLQRLDVMADDGLTAHIWHCLVGEQGAMLLELQADDAISIHSLGRKDVATQLVMMLAAVEAQDASPHIPQQEGTPGKVIPVKRFCTQCGQLIDPSWKFCIHCGSKIMK